MRIPSWNPLTSSGGSPTVGFPVGVPEGSQIMCFLEDVFFVYKFLHRMANPKDWGAQWVLHAIEICMKKTSGSTQDLRNPSRNPREYPTGTPRHPGPSVDIRRRELVLLGLGASLWGASGGTRCRSSWLVARATNDKREPSTNKNKSNKLLLMRNYLLAVGRSFILEVGRARPPGDREVDQG